MTRNVSNFSDLIQRAQATCLLHSLSGENEEEEEYHSDSEGNKHEENEDENEDYGEEKISGLMEEVFEAVSRMKRAYVSLQEAHCPWDPEKMRLADVAVVRELKKLCVLRERFRRRRSVDGACGVREVVAPCEVVMEKLKKEVKAKDFEVQNLKEKLESIVTLSSSNGGEKKGVRSRSKTKVRCRQIQAVAATPSPELFEAAMLQVRKASKSFTLLLLSLMHNAHLDITTAVHSVEADTATTNKYHNTSATTSTMVSAHQAKYALESYISQKIFHGFDHETFYMDGSLSSLLNPDQFRRDCFTQYRDMKYMDPTELLGVFPTCHFGKFCSNKYLAIVHPKMEESLFGNLEQHNQVSVGKHPRTQFYNEFLGVAKAMWLLHLLAFSLNPVPSQFEASEGAEFHSQYMESVVKFSGGQVVGFSVSPGFKFGSEYIIKARVYLMART